MRTWGFSKLTRVRNTENLVNPLCLDMDVVQILSIAGVYLVFEVLQEREFRKCWQFPISFYVQVSCFLAVSDNNGASLLLPCSQNNAQCRCSYRRASAEMETRNSHKLTFRPFTKPLYFISSARDLSHRIGLTKKWTAQSSSKVSTRKSIVS